MSDTESLNPRFADIDLWPTAEAVDAMLEGQLAAIAAIRNQTSAVAAAAEAAADRLRHGGRLVYAGAGTSGRIAVQDGVELGPTFGWPDDRLIYLMAGGINALVHSAEGAEDDGDDAAARIAGHAIEAGDVVIGVAASGRTPFTVAALRAAGERGALTIAIANNAGCEMFALADHPLLAATGSEIIAGSTRMKAGTAQKVMLNLLSTSMMIRLGRVHRGLMVDMVISNDKLQRRAVGIVEALARCSADDAADALQRAGNNIKAAVLVAMGRTPAEASAMLERHGGVLRAAMARMQDGAR